MFLSVAKLSVVFSTRTTFASQPMTLVAIPAINRAKYPPPYPIPFLYTYITLQHATRISDELSSVTEETAMSVEEKERHEALVERCCAETPKGESYRALFSNSSSKVLAEHLDNVVNNPQDFRDG